MSRFEETEATIKLHKAIEAISKSNDGSTFEIPIENITVNDNIRSSIDFDSPSFKQLVESIRESGLIQLPAVTIHDNRIVCIAGHRRIEALKQLGETKVRCTFRKIESAQYKRLAQIIENTARENLLPLDLVDAVYSVKDEERLSSSRLAELLGKERKYVERPLKIYHWPNEAKSLVRQNPQKFTLKKLFSISSRRLSDEEVVTSLKAHLGDEVVHRAGAVSKVVRQTLTLRSFFEEKKVTEREKALILDAMRVLKIKTEEVV